MARNLGAFVVDGCRAEFSRPGCRLRDRAGTFYAVGLSYEDFTQTTDEEVRTLLERAARAEARRTAEETNDQKTRVR
jgi:hypothetical protein